MNLRTLVLGSLSLGLALTQLGCASQFKAVQATGAVGQKLSSFDGTFTSIKDQCLITTAVTGTDPKSCDALQAGITSWQKTTALLAAYAGALSQLAIKEPVSVKDLVDSVVAGTNTAKWTTLKDTETGAVKDLAAQVANLLTNVYKKDQLEGAIKYANPHVQTIAAQFALSIDTEISNLQLLDEAIAGNAQRLDGELAAAQKKAAAAAAAATPPPAPAVPAVPAAPEPVAVKELRHGGHRPKAAPPVPKPEPVPVPSKPITAPAEAAVGSDAMQALRPVAVALHLQAALFHYEWRPKKEAALTNLKNAVVAFAKCHDELSKHFDRLDGDEVLEKVVGLIKEVYGDVATLTPAAPAAPPR